MNNRRTEELTCRFEGEWRVFGDGGDRTVVANAWSRDQGTFRLKGRAEPGELEPGVFYRFFGKWVEHDRYGRQFHFRFFVEHRSLDRRGVVRYLQKAPHIGPRIAERLFGTLGEQAVEKLRTDPVGVAECLGRKVLTAARAAEASEWLNNNIWMEHTTIELFNLLDGRGFPRTLMRRCLDTWGIKAPAIIRENPFELTRFSGVGFLGADRLWMELGKDPHDIRRQVHCIWNSAADTGSTWKLEGIVLSSLREKIGGTQVRTADAVVGARQRGLIVTHVDDDGERWVATQRRAAEEAFVAERTIQLMSEPAQWPDMLDDDTLSVHQRGQLMKALRGKIACLCGPPGVGKSYTAARLIKRVIEEHGKADVAVFAPTGKASQRVRELLLEHGVDVESSTSHRMLRVEMQENGDWSFVHNRMNHLPVKYLIGDEMSMKGTGMMQHVMAAMAPEAHLLLIGDRHQLSPVEHGKPFVDLMDAGVPTGELTEPRRNCGAIVTCCHAMIRDSGFPTSGRWAPDEGDNLYLIEAHTAARQITILESVYDRLRQSSRKFDPVWDVQVICAVNDKGPLSRKALNERLREILNPAGERCERNPFRIGDKVICLKNHRAKAMDEFAEGVDEKGMVAVMNGEMARVTAVQPGWSVVELENPYRQVKVLHSARQADSDEEDVSQWDMGYAISSHKSQGSEWPIVIPMLDNSNGAEWICDRAWLYTAISRAKWGCLPIGKRRTAQAMCDRVDLDARKTFLRDRIAEAASASAAGRSAC